MAMNNYSQMPIINIDPPSMDEYDNMKNQSSLNPIFQSFLGMNIEMQSEQIDKNISLLSMTDTLSGNTLLHIAVQSENYPLIELLINKGTCINARNNLEQTPLHLAIHTENHKIINLLLEQKADPNIQDRNGETPMHIAAYNGDYKVIKLLLLFKANMFLRNNPEASLVRLERREKQEMLNQAANSVAEILGVDKEDPTLKAAIEVAGSLIGLNKYDN